jgi:zinc-ribbon domain
MEPEIARRCLACGASVRGTAVFCPECGRPLKASSTNVDAGGEAADSLARRRADGVGTAPVITTSIAGEPAQEIPAQDAAGENPPRADSNALPASEGLPFSKRPRITAARDAAQGKIAPRVEKLRQASNVMLEEASYDPSLRFVLVALAIFVLSLLILLLNHLLG